MPSIHVADNVELAYDDSGVPEHAARPYVTVVLVHGTIFYNSTYRYLMPFIRSSILLQRYTKRC